MEVWRIVEMLLVAAVSRWWGFRMAKAEDKSTLDTLVIIAVDGSDQAEYAFLCE